MSDKKLLQQAIHEIECYFRYGRMESPQSLMNNLRAAIAQPVQPAQIPSNPSELKVQQEADKGVFSMFNACMYKEQCRAAIAQPAQEGDAKDAQRYRWLLDCGTTNLWIQCGRMDSYDDVEAVIDAAIASLKATPKDAP